MPHDFPPWQTVYHYFGLWRHAGVFEHLNQQLREQLRLTVGRAAQPSGAILDSQPVKTTDTEQGESVAMTVPHG